jgi:outer membrane receptor protein involved in Fe transport
MSRRSSGGSRSLRALAVGAVGVGLFLVPLQPLEAQERGYIAGVLLDESSGEPLREATVSLIGLGLEATTDENGQFLLDGVPVGAIEVRFEAPGYMSVREELELSEADFFQVRLIRVRAVLDEIFVVTGRRSRAADRDDIRLDDDAEAWRSVLNVLEDQVPGVVVRRGGNLGGGAYLFMRGASSFQRDNAPEVYLDGVRLSGGNTDRWSLHVLDMISAEEVDRIRVLKGAASTSGATFGGANGVILIETRKGGGPAEPN